MQGHKAKLPNWEAFVGDCLENHNPYLYVEGRTPTCIFEVCTHEGARKAIDLLTRLKIKNFVLFSVEGCDRSTALMMTGMLVRDLPDAELYVEDQAIYADGAFPRITSGEIDKESWRAFAERMRG